MGKLYKENWYKKWQKEAILGKFPRVYRYRYKAVLVQPTRSQPVSVQANRMQPVPVQLQGVPVQVCPNCPDCVVFGNLSLNSYTVNIGTLLND